ncbi:MAG: tripartite tricarboxylate transporter TctB family protein [Alphaproteobacteria bacterium]
MSLNVKEAAAALALLALAAVAWLSAVTFAAEARVFPRLVAGVMAALALVMLGRSFFMNSEERRRQFFKHFPTFMLCLGLILGYVYTTSLLGYFTASAIFVPAFALLLGLRRPVVIVASTLGFLLVTHLVFVEAFERPLPVEFFLRQ